MIGYTELFSDANKNDELLLYVPVSILIGLTMFLFFFIYTFKYDFGYFLEGTLVSENKIKILIPSRIEKEILTSSILQIGGHKYFIEQIEVGEIFSTGGVLVTEVYFITEKKEITTKYIEMKLITMRETLWDRLISNWKGE